MRSRVLAIALATSILGSGAAHANTISQAFACGKDAGNTAIMGAKSGVKIAQLAENRPECVSKAVGQDYLLFGVTGALFVLQAKYPNQIKVGSCESSLRDTLAEPFAKAIGGVVPSPAGDMITDYLQHDGAVYVWNFLAETPPIDMFMVEVSCGCAFVDAGINAKEVKATLESNLKTAKTCTGLVKESCKDMAAVSSAAAEFCMGSLDFAGDAVKDGAKAVSDGVIAFGEMIGGQTNAVPADQYYATWFKPYVTEAAKGKALDPAFNWRTNDFWNQAMGSRINNNGNAWTAACRGYFDGHKYSSKNAHDVCETMAGWMDAAVDKEAAIYKSRVDLKKAWAAEKAKQTAVWAPLCGSDYQCPKSVEQAIGGYEDNKFNQGPWEYKSWGMFGKMRKALDSTGDVQAAIVIGASAARPELAQAVANAYRPSFQGAATGCFPAGGANCKAKLDDLEKACVATLKAVAVAPGVTAAKLSAEKTKCLTSGTKYVLGGWKTYLDKSFAACTQGCPSGAFHDRCEAEVKKTVNATKTDVGTKLYAGKVVGPETVTAEVHRCTVATQVYAGYKKKEDAFFAKWGSQCPKSTGPKPLSQAVSTCESKLRAAFEACGDRFFDECTDKGAKVALAEAWALSSDAKAKEDARVAQQLKDSGKNLNPATVGAISAGPKPAGQPIGTTAKPPPPSGTVGGAHPPPASGLQPAKVASGLAPGGVLKPLIDAGCRASPGDPSTLICPAAAMERCNRFRAEGKVKACRS